MSESSSNENWKRRLFTYRSYTPLPFLAVMLLFAAPTLVSLVTGFAVAGAGELIRLWGVSYAGSETRTTGRVGGTRLVTSGPYSHVRNPLYLGNILLYLGIGIMSNALVPYLQLSALAYFIFQYSAIVSIEERYLAETFPDWPAYTKSVPRFIPRLAGFAGDAGSSPDYLRALRSERSSLLAFFSVTVILCAVYVLRGAS